ncbi:MAG: acyl-CoA dehydrogenase [Pseudonocardiaceae bacterium]|nr:acyl-CoA dehydrogenase [Pseudonocardiaceae bacterium]
MEGAAPVSEPTTRDLLYGEVEDDVRASARKLLADRCATDAVLARCESDEPYDLATWRTLSAELGFAGLLVPEADGGAGASAREAAVVAEELGRSVAPLPFLGSAVLATSALLACKDSQTCPQGRAVVRELLAALGDGSRTGTLAVPLSTAPGAGFPDAVRATGGCLTGRVGSVVDLDVADVVLVGATDEDGPALYAVDLPGSGATRHPVVSLDLTRRVTDLELDGAAGRRVAGAADAEVALHAALTTGAGLLAAEQLGLAEWCLDTTVEFAKTRYQFGRPIGSFQALKHRLADVWAAVSTARSVARAAANALATGAADTELVVAVAAAYCSDTAVLAAEECVQLHGGIGMTWEHPAHLYLCRAKTSQLALGTPDGHRATLAELANLPAT